MSKQCSDSGCSRRVIYACGCTDPKMHFCDDHYSRHLRTPASHLPECMIIELTPDQRNQILPRLRDLILHLEQHEIDTIRTSRELIDYIMKCTSKTLSNLHDLERAIVDIIGGRSIEKDYYETIYNFSLESNHQVAVTIGKLKNDIKNSFRFDEMLPGKSAIKCISSENHTVVNLLSIDSNTFTLPSLNLAPKSAFSEQEIKLCFKCSSICQGQIVIPRETLFKCQRCKLSFHHDRMSLFDCDCLFCESCYMKEIDQRDNIQRCKQHSSNKMPIGNPYQNIKCNCGGEGKYKVCDCCPIFCDKCLVRCKKNRGSCIICNRILALENKGYYIKCQSCTSAFRLETIFNLSCGCVFCKKCLPKNRYPVNEGYLCRTCKKTVN